MEDGNDDETLARTAGDNRQRGIHRRGSSHTDRCQLAEIPYQQRRTEQGENLSADICQQGYRPQLRSTILRDKDTRQRVISESRTYSQTVRQLAMTQQQGSCSASGKGAQDCHHRQHHQSGIHLSETLQHRSITSDADSHTEHQAAKRTIAHVAIQQPGWNTSQTPTMMPSTKKPTIIKLPFIPCLLSAKQPASLPSPAWHSRISTKPRQRAHFRHCRPASG